MKNKETLLKALEKYVSDNDSVKVSKICDGFHSSEIYDFIKDWPIEKSVVLIRLLDSEKASEIFSEFEPDEQVEMINKFSKKEIKELFDELYTDEAIDIIEELPKPVSKKILSSISAEDRKKINDLLKFKQYQSGYNMVVEFVSVRNTWTVEKANQEVKKQINKDELEILGIIFVTNSKGEYKGYITPEMLLSENKATKISKIIEKSATVTTSDPLDVAREIISTYEIPSAPVVNKDGILVGAIESEDIIEMYENIEEAKGYSKTETKKAFLDHSPKELFKQRAPWILTLILIGGITQMIILGFGMIWKGQGIDVPSGNPDTTFIPVFAFTTAIEVGGSITDTAGNTGSQSSTMLIRAIAVNEVNETNYKKALKLEMKTSLLLASASAIVGMARMYIVWGIMGMLNGLNAQEWGWYSLIAALAALTYFLSIVTGNFIAAILPIMADKYKWDGAIFSGPLQTTLIDIIGIAIYLGITSAVFIPLVNTGVL